MKRLLLLLSIVAIAACNREEGRLGLEVMSLKTAGQPKQGQLTNEQLIALAHNKEHIHLSVEAAKNVFENIKAGAAYNADTFNLFRAAVHRFYSTVSVKDRQLILNLQSGKEIGIDEDLFRELRYGIDVLNNDLSKEGLENEMSDSAIISSIHAQLRSFPN